MIPLWQAAGGCGVAIIGMLLVAIASYYLGRADGVALAHSVDSSVSKVEVEQ